MYLNFQQVLTIYPKCSIWVSYNILKLKNKSNTGRINNELSSWYHMATKNVLYLVSFKDVYSDCAGAEPIVQIANDMLSYSSWYVACAFQPRLNKPRATNIYCM